MTVRGLAKSPLGRLGILATMAGAALLGCSPTAVLDALTPRGEFELRRDVPYGEAARQKLDIYRPNHGDGKGTLIVFFYGGSWRSGSKDQYRFVAEALTREGITVVIPDYRLYPEVEFPAFLQDGAAAVRWARDQAQEFGADPRRLFVMGHSAGAYIAAMLALDGEYLRGAGMRRNELAGAVGIAGPYDFLPFSKSVGEVFASTPDLARTQPITYAGPGAPPLLLLHGRADTMVYPLNSEHLAAKLERAGSPVELELYPERGHLDIMLGLSSVFQGDRRLISDLERFLYRPG